VNRQIILTSRPTGFPAESNFKLVQSELPKPREGQFLVRSLYLSVDPYMRGRMSDAPSYAPPVALGEVMVGGVVGEVMESRHPGFLAGDIVSGYFGWQEYAVSDGSGVMKLERNAAPVSTALGVLGMPGLTAYFGLLEIGKAEAGETVVVSSAAGAVGAIVGQIAKIRGSRVIGIAGSDAKVNYIVGELGFDGGFNYKTASDYSAKLKELCPRGVDCYFDNVGGPITDAVFQHLQVHARIVVCGQIALYNVDRPDPGPRHLRMLLMRQARAEGFLVFQFASRYGEGLRQLAEWVRQGKLKYKEDVLEGIESAPRAFLRMLRGENEGKQLVKVA
jgi:NADPH-dependent curcumin reductase CurA